jgi:hypothetical protein
MPRKRLLNATAAFVLLAAAGAARGQSTSPNVHPLWRTHAEQTDYRETPTLDETVEYLRRLAAASPWVRLQTFGRSGEGRALPLVVAARGGTLSPSAARRAGKAVVLVQACIHAGETDGKDAGLALLRDIAVTKTRAALLDRVVLLFIPVYNADGHERRSPFNRINQNGPAEMGWRANARNLNLNRDYAKADAPETRAWLRLWNEWRPDLFVDCHVTDGADYRYNVTYQFEAFENVDPSVRAWAREAFERRVVPAAEREGNLLSPYLSFRDNREPGRGVDALVTSPRFATGYAPLARNRPAILIETHMLKPHHSRVRGTYDLLRATLEEVNRDPDSLLSAVREADERAVEAGRRYDPARRVTLSVRLTDNSAPFLFKSWEFVTEPSAISGGTRVTWSTTPRDLTIPFYGEAEPAVAVAPPLYYVIPPQWTEVVEVLRAHGLTVRRLARAASLDVESFRFREMRFAPAPFEGRQTVRFRSEPVRERRTYAAGSYVVPLAQAGGRVALHLLEPDAPDSLVAWGFFQPVFEQKEYAEDYVLEKLAREMLAKDENLKREFEQRLAADPKFAASPSERLRFFHERSPYWDRRMNLYPVGRLTTPLAAPLVN